MTGVYMSRVGKLLSIILAVVCITFTTSSYVSAGAVGPDSSGPSSALEPRFTVWRCHGTSGDYTISRINQCAPGTIAAYDSYSGARLVAMDGTCAANQAASGATRDQIINACRHGQGTITWRIARILATTAITCYYTRHGSCLLPLAELPG